MENLDFIHLSSFSDMLIRFIINFVVCWFTVHWLYFRKSKRSDYYFTYMLISVSIFFLIYLLGGTQLKIEFALGLFAIFGIIRYRTEALQVREMTYLFVIIAISVINALTTSLNIVGLLFTNIIFIVCILLFECNKLHRQYATKMIKYDCINLITPDKRKELIEDIHQRTGLEIKKIEIGDIDFLKDMAYIKIFYTDEQV